MNKYLEESIKREEFRKKFDSLMSLYGDFDDLKLQAELKALIQSSDIDINCPYEDTFYEDLIQLLQNFDQEINKISDQEIDKISDQKNVDKKKFEHKSVSLIKNKEKKIYQKSRHYNPKYKKNNKDKYKKVYKDEYEAERDFKLNIYKKNLFATPYFQEKKRRNSFNFNKSKPKDKSGWKKKGKIHQK